MIPKEKAEELFKQYYSYLKANLMNDEEAREDAKECALIAIKFAKNSEYKYLASGGLWIDGTAHFEKIEQEIEKL